MAEDHKDYLGEAEDPQDHLEKAEDPQDHLEVEDQHGPLAHPKDPDLIWELLCHKEMLD